MKTPPCPCGRIVGYEACCGRLHRGLPAPDAEALMRSRYSAHVLGLADYLVATWHPDTRPTALDLDDAAGQRTTWLGLDVIARKQAGETATVDFVARFRVGGGSAQRLHEHSRFQRVDGRWLYVDGDVLQRAPSVLRR